MAKITKALTDTEIKKAKLGDGEKTRKLYDGDGLFLRLRYSNIKIWFFRYISPINNKIIELSIGEYPETTLKQAREQRDKYKKLLQENIDPKIYREQEKILSGIEYTNTFRNIAIKWFEWRKTKMNFSVVTAEKAWMRINKHLFPYIGNLQIDKLTPLLIISVLEPLKQKGQLETIKQVTCRLNEIMIYAVNTGIISHNPLANIRKMFDSPVHKNNPCIKYWEISKFLRLMCTSTIKDETKLLILFQMLTLARPAEAASAKFSDIDEENGMWSYYILKGKKECEQGRLHKVPLSKEALKIVQICKKNNKSGSPYLFPSRTRKNDHVSSQTANLAIKRLHNGFYEGKQTAHGLRSIGSTWLNERRTKDGLRKYDSDLIEISLSHLNKDEIRRTYNRSEYLPQRRKMLQDWANYLKYKGMQLNDF